MLKVSQLYIYPIKSMGGFQASSAQVTDRGLQYDRRWMLVNKENRFLTLREYPEMALLHPVLEAQSLRIRSYGHPGKDLVIPMSVGEDPSEKVTIWNAICDAIHVGKEMDQWFSEVLNAHCKLVYMPDVSMRRVDTTSGFAPEGKFTSFADAYPFMMLGEASMEDLNQRLHTPVSIMRFRPNIVFSGGTPYQEDEIEDFSINEIRFTGLENCARCQIPNVDPDTGLVNKDKEPLRTMSKYRTHNRNIDFGRNVVHSGTGIIRVGDEIKLV